MSALAHFTDSSRTSPRSKKCQLQTPEHHRSRLRVHACLARSGGDADTMAARGAACIRHMNDHRRTLAEPDGPTRVRTHGELAARLRGRKTTGRAIYESRGALANILSQTPRAEEVTVNEPTDALSHAQTGVAALIACVVQTLN